MAKLKLEVGNVKIMDALRGLVTSGHSTRPATINEIVAMADFRRETEEWVQARDLWREWTARQEAALADEIHGRMLRGETELLPEQYAGAKVFHSPCVVKAARCSWCGSVSERAKCVNCGGPRE